MRFAALFLLLDLVEPILENALRKTSQKSAYCFVRFKRCAHAMRQENQQSSCLVSLAFSVLANVFHKAASNCIAAKHLYRSNFKATPAWRGQ